MANQAYYISTSSPTNNSNVVCMNRNFSVQSYLSGQVGSPLTLVSNNPMSANSQFYITISQNKNANGTYNALIYLTLNGVKYYVTPSNGMLALSTNPYNWAIATSNGMGGLNFIANFNGSSSGYVADANNLSSWWSNYSKSSNGTFLNSNNVALDTISNSNNAINNSNNPLNSSNGSFSCNYLFNFNPVSNNGIIGGTGNTGILPPIALDFDSSLPAGINFADDYSTLSSTYNVLLSNNPILQKSNTKMNVGINSQSAEFDIYRSRCSYGQAQYQCSAPVYIDKLTGRKVATAKGYDASYKVTSQMNSGLINQNCANAASNVSFVTINKYYTIANICGSYALLTTKDNVQPGDLNKIISYVNNKYGIQFTY